MPSLRTDPAGTLVLMACSATKLDEDRSVPLFELYDGPFWRTLRARRGAIVWSQVAVLSGGLGLRNAYSHHRRYDARISAAKVDALLELGLDDYPQDSKPGRTPSGPTIIQTLMRPPGPGLEYPGPWSQVIVAGSGEYRRCFLGLVERLKPEGYIAEDAPVACVEGGIGVQLGQLGLWLDQVNGIEKGEIAA